MYAFIIDNDWNRIDEFNWDLDSILWKLYLDTDFWVFYEKSVDPYWDTFFNKNQIFNLIIPSLEKLDKNSNILDFINLLKKTEYHTYLKILWD